jgi:epsilon-lactone hydrolase
VLSGDSAGENLALGLISRLGRAGLPRPVAIVCVSPVIDFTATGRSVTENAERDPIITRAGLLAMADAYLRGTDLTDRKHHPFKRI